jgi:hypothetical protein
MQGQIEIEDLQNLECKDTQLVGKTQPKTHVCEVGQKGGFQKQKHNSAHNEQGSQ